MTSLKDQTRQDKTMNMKNGCKWVALKCSLCSLGYGTVAKRTFISTVHYKPEPRSGAWTVLSK